MTTLARSALVVTLLAAGAARADIIADVRGQLAAGQVDGARKLVHDAVAAHDRSPALLEARSWLARNALANHRLPEALSEAKATHAATVERLAGASPDSDPHLATALGAAIEVEAQAGAALGERAAAIANLERELARYGSSSIAMRLRKNLNLLTMQGVAAPPLEREPHLGAVTPPLSALVGKPVLLFFWAYWCPDCKAMAGTVARLAAELGPAGLQLIMPTQTYGASMTEVADVRRSAYAALGDAPTPVSDANFARYGASSMPTVVVVDRTGKVALYHPGAMSYAELQPILKAAVAPAKH